MSVQEESSTKEPRRAHALTLTTKCRPHEYGKIPHRANAKTSNRGEHSPFILGQGVTVASLLPRYGTPKRQLMRSAF